MPHHYELAKPSDDPELRRLLRENPFEGNISLSFEREPNYFLASAVEGPFHQTLLVRDSQNGRIVGVGDRSVRPLYVNGKIKDVGYFSGLRVDKHYNHGLALARFLGKGWEGQRESHKDARCKYYLMSIVSDNAPARRLLDAKLPHYPRLHHYQRMFTYAIHPRRAKSESKTKIVRGSLDMIPAIVDCLHRNGMRRQFAPHWTEETLLSSITPGLAIEDFFLAQSDSRVIGCLALWDQRSFKQSVIRGYAGIMARFRKVINQFTPLPEPGQQLNQCFAAFLAVDDDNPEIFSALFRALYNEAYKRKYSYINLGLPEGHSFHKVLKAYLPIIYKSDIYLAAWEDGFNEIAKVDKRQAGLEIAIL